MSVGAQFKVKIKIYVYILILVNQMEPNADGRWGHFQEYWHKLNHTRVKSSFFICPCANCNLFHNLARTAVSQTEPQCSVLPYSYFFIFECNEIYLSVRKDIL